jgi:putative autoinducer-2 (AI-2) aldolase
MPEADDSKRTGQYHPDKSQKAEPFFLKGSGALDWGMKNRLARIFSPASGRTVMLLSTTAISRGPPAGWNG